MIKCDCSVDAEVLGLKTEAYARFGAVHFLMNNAATQTNNNCGPYEYPDRWRKILDINLFGVYLGGLHFVPSMIAQAFATLVPRDRAPWAEAPSSASARGARRTSSRNCNII